MGVFTEIYGTNGWSGSESVSGTGSSLDETEVIRSFLPQIVQQLRIATLLDIPCGDFHWMRHVDLASVHYTGADVVDILVEENRRRFSDDMRMFLTLDLTKDSLPKADMILCRDCLFHLSFKDISRAIANIQASGAHFILTTTNPMLERNIDIVTGEWRRLNLQASPFSFPKPIQLIKEGRGGDHNQDKALGLWRINDLPTMRLH
jgi:hypothetical protein